MENIIEEKKEIITYCSMCGKVLNGKKSGRFVLCERCGVWIPIGSDSFYLIKGGGNMTEKKVAAEKAKAVAKADKTEVAKGPSAKEILAEKAILVDEAITKLFPEADKAELKKINHVYWKTYLN